MSNDVHDRIKAYVYKITRGLVSLKEEHTTEIERLVKKPRAYAKLSKWDAQKGFYVEAYTETTSDEDIKIIIAKYESKKPITNFAKWELYSSDGELMKTIYTTSYILNYLTQ